MTLNDQILSIEAQLLYDRTVGLEPAEGDLTRWRGVARSSRGPVPFEIIIPPEFPQQPPRVKIQAEIRHQQVTSDGYLKLRILDRWRPTNHVYHVVSSVLSTMESLVVPVRGAAPIPSSRQNLDLMRTQVTNLRSKLDARRQELVTLKSQGKSAPLSSEIVERSKTDIENELWEIETLFERSEINAREYAKKYVDARKRLEIMSMATLG